MFALCIKLKESGLALCFEKQRKILYYQNSSGLG
jgi:hypothetical protein